MALDAKFNFDPNALFRHADIVAYRDLDEEDRLKSSTQAILASISLDGNIGCSMAWLTHGHHHESGGEPANFLTLAAPPPRVTEAFKMMPKNPGQRPWLTFWRPA
jgi:succinyl-CoA synthetase beta subunit